MLGSCKITLGITCGSVGLIHQTQLSVSLFSEVVCLKVTSRIFVVFCNGLLLLQSEVSVMSDENRSHMWA